MKAVFIDGPSIHHMGHAIGIARFNYFSLYKFLAEDVSGSTKLATPIFITVTPAMGKGAAKAYRAAGFDVLETTSTNSEDDQAIITRINDLDPEKVTEIVLVSTDQDYIAALRSKVKQGKKVWWVGVSGNGTGNTPLMTQNLKPFLATEFDFIDLVDFKDKVMGLPKKMSPVSSFKTPTRSLRIELSGAQTHDEYMDIVALLNRALRKTPHIKFRIEG